MDKGVKGRNKTLIGELDYKILDYLNKNGSGCMTDLMTKFKSGSQHLSKRLKHLKKYKLISPEKAQGKKINYSINDDKIKLVNAILEIFK
jgi:predicted transcriptional regulator